MTVTTKESGIIPANVDKQLKSQAPEIQHMLDIIHYLGLRLDLDKADGYAAVQVCWPPY